MTIDSSFNPLCEILFKLACTNDISSFSFVELYTMFYKTGITNKFINKFGFQTWINYVYNSFNLLHQINNIEFMIGILSYLMKIYHYDSLNFINNCNQINIHNRNIISKTYLNQYLNTDLVENIYQNFIY